MIVSCSKGPDDSSVTAFAFIAVVEPFLAAAPLLMDSIPVKTSAGYLLYHAGRLAGAAPNLAPVGTAAGVAAPLLRPQENQ